MSMMRCSKEAFARCPHGNLCDATFIEGSECDRFNQQVERSLNHTTAVCPACNGRGHINGGTEHSSWSRTCERCHGTGYTMVPITEGDRIRAMSDEELARFIQDVADLGTEYGDFCQQKMECSHLLECDEDIPDEWCMKCRIEWLRRPVNPKPRHTMDDGVKTESGLLED